MQRAAKGLILATTAGLPREQVRSMHLGTSCFTYEVLTLRVSAVEAIRLSVCNSGLIHR